MKINEFIKNEIKKRNIVQAEVARKVKVVPQVLFTRLQGSNMQTERAIDILKAIDCRLYVRDRDGNFFEITNDTEISIVPDKHRDITLNVYNNNEER